MILKSPEREHQGEKTEESPASFEVAIAPSKDGEEHEVVSDLCENDYNDQVLESVDSCVNCVEGAELQQRFEEDMGALQLIESPPASEHQRELSPTEAAMIRMQIVQNQDSEATKITTLNDIDLLNICCSKEGMNGVRSMAAASGVDPAFIPSVAGTDSSSKVDSTSATKSVVENANSDKPFQCVICFDEAMASSNTITFAKFPCCGSAFESSPIKICTSCVLVLTNPTSDGSSRVGRCLRCRSWIAVRVPASAQHSELQVSPVTAAGSCKICNQEKEYLVDSNVCDACFLGRRYPLLYECETCHSTQRIPHPMYRYQSSPNRFGNVTWACQGKCAGFTNWRIRAEQVELIPVGDAPKEWGGNYLLAARARVAMARTQLAGEEGANTCAIL